MTTMVLYLIRPREEERLMKKTSALRDETS